MDGWPLAGIILADDMDQPSPTVIGVLIVGFITLLNAALAIKQLLEKRPDREAVPRKEFDEFKAGVVQIEADSVHRKEFDELKAQVASGHAHAVALTGKLVDYVTRREMDDLRIELNRQYERLERYARNRSHKLTSQVHEIQMSIEVLHRNVQAEMANLISRVTERQERHQTALAEMRAVIERRLPKGPGPEEPDGR